MSFWLIRKKGTLETVLLLDAKISDIFLTVERNEGFGDDGNDFFWKGGRCDFFPSLIEFVGLVLNECPVKEKFGFGFDLRNGNGDSLVEFDETPAGRWPGVLYDIWLNLRMEMWILWR